MLNFYQKLLYQLSILYPSAKISEEQIKKCASPFTIKIPLSVSHQIQTVVKYIFEWSRLTDISSIFPAKNNSVLMAYDFHLDLNGNARLIEINTNAAGFLIVDLIQKIKNIQSPALENLKQSFFNEWFLFSSFKTPPQKTAIIDDNISNQKMNFEFSMYSDLMNTWGWQNLIIEASTLKLNAQKKIITPENQEVDFIYSRLTDFYLKEHPHLKTAYENHNLCLSPNPKEYALMADKKNLCRLYSSLLNSKKKKETCSSIDWKILGKTLVPSFVMSEKDFFWKNKKKFFFKPSESYAGKGSYRGASITKKKFQTLKNYIVQEYIPPMEWICPDTQEAWKTDIRAYVYQEKVHLIGGRIYKGQLTNFQNLYGGFCSVEFV